MEKKTINVSQQLLTSILIGFLIAIVVAVIAHISPKNWMSRPESSGYTFSPLSKVSNCGYECMFGARHSADCAGLSVFEVGTKGIALNEVFSASFDHMSFILLFGIIISSVTYIFKRVNFKIAKE